MTSTGPYYRLAIRATALEMGQIANELTSKFPHLAAAIKKQQREIQNSGVDVFGAFRHDPSEPIAGLSDCPIKFMAGVPD